MRTTAHGLIALSPPMRPSDALRALETALDADPSRVAVQVVDLTASVIVELTERTPMAYLEEKGPGHYMASMKIIAHGITTHLLYFVDREPEGLLLRRGLENMHRVSPGEGVPDMYNLEIDFA